MLWKWNWFKPISYTDAAPTGTGYHTLQLDDAGIILEELMEAQNESRSFGLVLNLAYKEVAPECSPRRLALAYRPQ